MTADRDAILLEAAEWYSRVMEDDDPVAAEGLHDWLDADPLHAECWTDIVQTGAGIARLQPATSAQWDAPPAEPTKLPPSAPYRTAGRVPPWRRGKRRIGLVAVAAAVCAVALAAPQALLWMQADQITGAGEVRAIRLADGSRVDLGPASAIAVDYSGRQRHIRLIQGEAWFEVARDPVRPFRVKADRLTATVLGTGFEVQALGNADRVRVGHGRVRVEERGGASPARELTAGQWVTIGSGSRLTAGTASATAFGQWREGGLFVEGESIGSVIDQIRPWYQGKIMVLSGNLSTRPVTGFVKANDPVRAITNLVAPHGGKVTRVTPWVLIVSGG
ncbi:MAG: FecR domain-containing protein [Sphingobium sp.]